MSTVNKENLVQLIPFQPGDEQGIQRLFQDVFGIDRPFSLWSWQFAEHPEGNSWILLAKMSGDIIGHFAFRRNHINFLGKEIVGGQACDAMIRSDWQGKGLFSKMFLRGNDMAREDQLQVAFGFPNRASYPADMRKLNRQRIHLNYYGLRIGYRRFTGRIVDSLTKTVLALGRALNRPLEQKFLPGDCHIVVGREVPEEAAEMLAEWHNYEVLSVWKDPQYLRWRYEKHPVHRYLFHCLFVGGCLEGLAVTRECGENVVICEFMHRSKDLRQSVALLRAIVRRYILRSFQKIEFIGWDSGFFDFVFTKCGFSKSPCGLFFTAECFGHKKIGRMLSVPQNWTIVQGDMDVM